MLALLGAVIVGAPSIAEPFFLFDPVTRRAGGEFEFDVEIAHSTLLGTSPSTVTWNDGFLDALNAWNNAAGLGALIDLTANGGVLEDPCDVGDGVNGVGFRAVDACPGVAWEATTLAIARRNFTGSGFVTEGNIIFRDDGTAMWNIVAGNQGAFDDFRRVAVHEIGHLLGLDHPPTSVAIMNAVVQDTVEVPQSDDIQGILAIYDLGCPIVRSAGSASIAETLDATDCLDTEIPAGLAIPGSQGICTQIAGSFEPDVLVDLYQVVVPSGVSLDIAMSAANFTHAVQVFTPGLDTELNCAWANFGNPSGPASLNLNLAAGTYVVAARSVFSGSGSDYTLVLTPEPGAGVLGALTGLVLIGRLKRRRP